MTLTRRQRFAYQAEHRIANRIEPELRRGFLSIMQDLRQGSLPILLSAIRGFDPEQGVERLPWIEIRLELLARFRAAYQQTVERAMRAQIASLPQIRKADSLAALGLRFDLTNPRALKWIDEHAAELVVEITEETKLAIRNQIRQMFLQGIPPNLVRRRLETIIGLTRRDAQAVANLRSRLELENAKRIAEQRKPLPQQRIDDPVEAYAGRLLRRRAERIARTESIRASAEGQQELWTQAREQRYLEPERTRRAWLVTPDERLCPICAPLAATEKLVALDQPFALDTGESVMTPPAHPLCRCATGLVFSDEEGNFQHPQGA